MQLRKTKSFGIVDYNYCGIWNIYTYLNYCS